MSDLITTQLVTLDAHLGTSTTEVINHLANLVAKASRATDASALAEHALAREAKTATGVPGGIAIPHCRSAAVTTPTLAMARLATPVDFGAKDGPADLIFFIAAPEGADKEHLKLLSKLARALVKKTFTAALREATSASEIVALVSAVISDNPTVPAAAPVAAPAPTTDPSRARVSKIVAVTACPTGIAHTYMAADSLAQTAEELGIDFAVETQGSSGSTALDPAIIEAADAVIFAVDVDVRDRARFAGKPLIQVPVNPGIS